MSIITIVEGTVPAGRNAELEDAFSQAKAEPLPPGLITSTLLRNKNQPQNYLIQTVWLNHEALERMRQTTKTPKAFELFKKVGAEASIKIFEVAGSVP